MTNLLELTTELVATHASTNAMTKEELLPLVTEVYRTLESMAREPEAAKKMETAPIFTEGSRKKAFGKNQVVCLVCGKGMKTLARHLRTAHGLTPEAYRVHFGIPAASRWLPELIRKPAGKWHWIVASAAIAVFNSAGLS